MILRVFLRLSLFSLLLSVSSASARAHDLTASHLIARLKPEGLELQIKVAADSIWPLVQEISPGAVYTAEDFETVEKPLLLAFAKTMDEFTVDGKRVTPSRTDVLIVEDTFLFSFIYPILPQKSVQLKELYLKKMSPDYISHLRLFDRSGTLLTSKDLTASDPVFEFTSPPPSAQPAQVPPVNKGRNEKAVTPP